MQAVFYEGNQIITDIRPLRELEVGFKQMESGGQVMKILLEAY